MTTNTDPVRALIGQWRDAAEFFKGDAGSDIRETLMACASELEAALAQQPAAPSGAVNVVGMPEFDGLLDHIYEHGTAADGVIERANAFARAVLARYAPRHHGGAA